MTDQLTEHEIDGLVERLSQRPEVQLAILEERISKAKAILCATIPQSQLALEIIRAVEALEGKPLVCQECGQAFRPGSAHPRKYCSYECAHRATDRDWHRRKRAEALEGK